MVAPSFGQARYRSVPAEMLLPAGWITGTFVVPEDQSFLDFLAHSGAFLKLTDALVPGHQDVAPFFAIQRGAVQLIVPSAGDDRVVTPGSMGITAPWSISCLFERGAMHGSLDFLMNQRLSDYPEAAGGFPGDSGGELDPHRRRQPAVALLAARPGQRTPAKWNFRSC